MGDEFFERRVGTEIHGKWTLEKLLGVGGMAAVYLGRHRIGRCDAIKILHPSAARSDETRARFEQEARAVARLGHPGTVRIDDIDTAEDGSIYLVMELLEGESLADRLDRGGASSEDALRWADEILDVLAAAHAIGIVHRDVKPDNVFLTRDGRVKLLDFGVAQMRDVGSFRTATGVALGTLPFMAPEQVRGEAVDARIDLFALGATLVRAIGRRKVHEASSDAELMMRMGSQPAPPASSLIPNAPEALWPLVDRALAFERALRYPDAATMQRDVRALRAGGPAAFALAAPALAAPALAAASEQSVVPVSAPPPSPALSKRALAILGGSIAAGVLLTVLVVLALRGDGATADAGLAVEEIGPASSVAPRSGLEVQPAAPRPVGERPGSRATATRPGSPTSPNAPPGAGPRPPGSPPGGTPPPASKPTDTAEPPASPPAPPAQPPRSPPEPGKKKGKDDDDDDRGRGRDKGDRGDKKNGGRRDRD